MSGRQQQVLLLYRRILIAAKKFPSIKRDSIIEDIKLEFRENKSLTDKQAVNGKIKVAIRSLDELESYASLDSKSSEWSKSLRGSCE